MLGYKLLAVNLSDLDASGARPVGFSLTLAVGRDIAPARLELILEGLALACREYDVSVIGGDTVGRETGLGLGVTAYGVAHRRLYRNGVLEGDSIYVDSVPGASIKGLRKLVAGQRWDYDHPDPDLLAHLNPTPEIGLGVLLATLPEVHACIDISDGLCKDLTSLALASNVSIVVGSHLCDDALYGGEDFSRCFATNMALEPLQNVAGRKFHLVARAIQKTGIPLLRHSQDGVVPVIDRSFKHFESQVELPVSI
jgi:thiamine-monophosphate kinase